MSKECEWVEGLREVAVGELVRAGSALGLVVAIDASRTLVQWIDRGVSAQDSLQATGSPLRFPVGRELLGRTIDALGRSQDDAGPLSCTTWVRRFRAPKPFRYVDRWEGIRTGILELDGLVPLERGKTHSLVGNDASVRRRWLLELMVRHARMHGPVVLVAVGWDAEELVKLRATLSDRQALSNCCVVSAGVATTAGLQLLSVEAGVAIAEALAQNDEQVLLLWDDWKADMELAEQLSETFPSAVANGLSVVSRSWSCLDRSGFYGAGQGSLTVLTSSADFSRKERALQFGPRARGCLTLSRQEVSDECVPRLHLGITRRRENYGPAMHRLLRPVLQSLADCMRVSQSLGGVARAGEVSRAAATMFRRRLMLERVLLQNTSRSYSLSECFVVLFALSDGMLDALPAAKGPEAIGRILSLVADQFPAMMNELPKQLTDAQRTAMRACMQLGVEITPLKEEPEEPSIPRTSARSGMTKDEYVAVTNAIADEQPEVDRPSPTELVFWIPSNGTGIERQGRRPVYATLRADGIAIIRSPIGKFYGQRSVAADLLRRNIDGSCYSRTTLSQGVLHQIFSCKLEHLTAQEWLQGFQEVCETAEQRALDIGDASSVVGKTPGSTEN